MVRLIYGIMLVITGSILIAAWARHSHSLIRWIFSIFCIAGGVVAIFEAKAAWCVVRAIGIRTPV